MKIKMQKKWLVMVLVLMSQMALAGWPNVSEPPRSTLRPVAEELYINGVETRLSEFESKLSARQVLNYYRNHWDNRYAESDYGPWQQISRLQGAYFITIQVQDNEMAGSKGRISIMNTSVPKRRVGSDVPLMNQSRVMNEVISKDKLSFSTIVLAVNPFAVEDNVEFYQQYFQQAGWKKTMDQFKQEKGATLVFNRDKLETTITITRIQGGSSVLINQVEQRSWFN